MYDSELSGTFTCKTEVPVKTGVAGLLGDGRVGGAGGATGPGAVMLLLPEQAVVRRTHADKIDEKTISFWRTCALLCRSFGCNLERQRSRSCPTTSI
jgi:hypothetical protein